MLSGQRQHGLWSLLLFATLFARPCLPRVAKGAPPSQSGGWDSPGSKGRFAYLDTEPYGSVTIELLWNAPAR
jgi:hypothetical protein